MVSDLVPCVLRISQLRDHSWTIEGRYKAIPIDGDAYFLQCGRYIELNPVRAKIVRHPEEYPWSSYHVYAAGQGSAIVDIHPMYQALGASPAVRQRRYRGEVEGELLATRNKKAMRFSEQQVYGSPKFLDRLKRDFGFELLRDHPGRPRKT